MGRGVFYPGMHKAHNTEQGSRAGYSVAEFSALFGKHRSWGHRQVKKGRIKATTGFGAAIIAADQVAKVGSAIISACQVAKICKA